MLERESERWQKGNMESEREKYQERVGCACARVEKLRKNGRQMKEVVIMRDVQMQDQRERISEARYNKAYKQIVKEKVSSVFELFSFIH